MKRRVAIWVLVCFLLSFMPPPPQAQGVGGGLFRITASGGGGGPEADPNALHKSGGTMTGTITGFSTNANGDVMTIPACANDASCRFGSIRFESKGPYDNAPWFIRNTSADPNTPAGADHVLRFDYNLLALDDHGASRITTASHTASFALESRFPFGADPNVVRGLFELNLDIDPNIGTSTIGTKRPFAFHWDMDARALSTFQIGDPSDANSPSYLYRNSAIFFMKDDLFQVIDYTVPGSKDTDPNIYKLQQGRIVIDPGANASFPDDRAVIIQNAGGELKLNAGFNSSGTPQKVKIGSDSSRLHTSGNALQVGSDSSIVGFMTVGNSMANQYILGLRASSGQGGVELMRVENSVPQEVFTLTNGVAATRPALFQAGNDAANITGGLGVEAGDDDPACASNDYNIFADLSETKWKICNNGTKGELPTLLTGSATLDFPTTAIDTCDDLTISVTGAADGDVVAIGPVNASVSAGSQFTAWTSGTNTVTVRHCCEGAANCDPGSGTFKARVFKP